MTVYVDDAFIQASVSRFSSRWCHLTADTKEELHTFAQSIGLRRAWFQERTDAKPGSFSGESWHYDVTAGKRQQAVRAGAVPLTCEQFNEIIWARAPLSRARREAHGT